jgi:hypothetical protein
LFFQKKKKLARVRGVLKATAIGSLRRLKLASFGAVSMVHPETQFPPTVIFYTILGKKPMEYTLWRSQSHLFCYKITFLGFFGKYSWFWASHMLFKCFTSGLYSQPHAALVIEMQEQRQSRASKYSDTEAQF